MRWIPSNSAPNSWLPSLNWLKQEFDSCTAASTVSGWPKRTACDNKTCRPSVLCRNSLTAAPEKIRYHFVYSLESMCMYFENVLWSSLSLPWLSGWSPAVCCQPHLSAPTLFHLREGHTLHRQQEMKVVTSRVRHLYSRIIRGTHRNLPKAGLLEIVPIRTYKAWLRYKH